jgi:quinol monooxygenase YgiN
MRTRAQDPACFRGKSGRNHGDQRHVLHGVSLLQVHPGKLAKFKSYCDRFIELTEKEAGVLFYGFSFDGDQAHCREGYRDAAALLAHLDNVGALLQELLKISDLGSRCTVPRQSSPSCASRSRN